MKITKEIKRRAFIGTSLLSTGTLLANSFGIQKNTNTLCSSFLTAI